MRSIDIPQAEDRDWRYRALEILPGALSWFILLSPLIIGFISPSYPAFLIIAYLIFWLLRGTGIIYRTIQATEEIKKHKAVDWQALNDDLETFSLRAKKAPSWHARNLARVEKYIGH